MKQRNPFDRRSHRPHADTHSWAVSYVDLLTLLLCFFIIFFSMDKKDAPPPFLSQIVKAFGTPEVVPATAKASAVVVAAVVPEIKVEAPATGTGTGNGTDISKSTTTIQNIAMTQFVKDHGKVGLSQDQLIIEIPAVSFFPSSRKKLTPEGEVLTAKMIEGLKPYIGRIHVTVQGHTDPRPYKGIAHEDNWELSVLRASTVLKRFIAEGFPQEDVSAEGFADQRAKRSVSSATSLEELAYLRRITLKIREKGHD
ncbi:MAG TPA: flagellar motor protein MotB [Bacteriovoracaceae bacterium]|nr:flagellar motor protein MotB [Bacteriovoracaceae bacterium]